MLATPKSLRMHIGLFGRRNVGKSSLMNSLLGFPLSIVSEVAGTTTDPVEKAIEMPPLGPVVFVDTAGVDDVGDLGALRSAKTSRGSRTRRSCRGALRRDRLGAVRMRVDRKPARAQHAHPLRVQQIRSRRTFARGRARVARRRRRGGQHLRQDGTQPRCGARVADSYRAGRPATRTPAGRRSRSGRRSGRAGRSD